MTDLEMTKLCAVAMGYVAVDKSRYAVSESAITIKRTETSTPEHYNPLLNDAQAMALMKRFTVQVDRGIAHPHHSYSSWHAWSTHPGEDSWQRDLNRAIVECVAKIQAPAKVPIEKKAG